MASEFRYRRRVQFAETDTAGVLHFSNYFRLMEEAEHAWWRSCGLTVYEGNLRDDGVSWPRVATDCQYLAPVRFDDEIDIDVQLVRMGQRSVEFRFEFRLGERSIARGFIKAACCAMTPAGFQSQDIPERIRTILEPMVQST